LWAAEGVTIGETQRRLGSIPVNETSIC